MPTWLDVYPFKEKIHDLGPEQPLFVDVGGGIGHQSIALREKLPDVRNKIILQDMPATLDHAIKHDGVEVMAYDFWQPQVVKGAFDTSIDGFSTVPQMRFLPVSRLSM